MLHRLLFTAAFVAALPAAVHSQSVSAGVRVGTMGIGGEVGLGLTSTLGIRAGYSVIPLNYEAEYSGLAYTVSPTSPLKNVGVDFFPGFGTLRIGAGMLFASNPTELDGEYVGTFEVGGQTFAGDARIHGELDHGASAPYVLIGFGEPTGRGFNLFLDIGAAYFGEPSLTLTASGTATQDPRFADSLERERQAAERDANELLQILPIFSFGFRLGI